MVCLCIINQKSLVFLNQLDWLENTIWLSSSEYLETVGLYVNCQIKCWILLKYLKVFWVMETVCPQSIKIIQYSNIITFAKPVLLYVNQYQSNIIKFFGPVRLKINNLNKNLNINQNSLNFLNQWGCMSTII